MIYEQLLEKCLLKVQKPARYIGNEFGSVHKNHDGLMKFAFCFPDVYEVGMSHLGMKILYHMLNDRDDTVCERVYAPWVDMEEEMKKSIKSAIGSPLYAHGPPAHTKGSSSPLSLAKSGIFARDNILTIFE